MTRSGAHAFAAFQIAKTVGDNIAGGENDAVRRSRLQDRFAKIFDDRVLALILFLIMKSDLEHQNRQHDDR